MKCTAACTYDASACEGWCGHRVLDPVEACEGRPPADMTCLDFGFDEGPRAVPVVSGGIVYTFGAEGQLHAVDLAKGTRIWSHDSMRTYRVPKGYFGQAGSPLVEEGRVIATIGGAEAGIVAFDAKTGAVQWTATRDGASYSSGVGTTAGGRRLALFLTRAGLVGFEPATGTVRVQRPWRSRSAASVNAASPLVVGDLVFISAEYGPGAGVFRLTPTGLDPLWANDDSLSTHYATPDHPVQRRCREEMARWSGVSAETLVEGTDRCGVVSFCAAVDAMATAFGRLGVSDEPAAVTVREAILAHPDLVAGQHRLCTAVMQAYPGEILAKVGADGVYGVALPTRGLGLALKVQDGDNRAAMVALVAILAQLGLSPDPRERLVRFAAFPVPNTRGEQVGIIRAHGALATE